MSDTQIINKPEPNDLIDAAAIMEAMAEGHCSMGAVSEDVARRRRRVAVWLKAQALANADVSGSTGQMKQMSSDDVKTSLGREWLVIESSRKNSIFAPDDTKTPRGYLPRDVAEQLLKRDLIGNVWFTQEESDVMRQHPEWRNEAP